MLLMVAGVLAHSLYHVTLEQVLVSLHLGRKRAKRKNQSWQEETVNPPAPSSRRFEQVVKGLGICEGISHQEPTALCEEQ